MHHINKLILGTVQFGLNYGINNTSGKPSEEYVNEILGNAQNQGIKILDTADFYGNASQIIGKYNANHQQFTINTKFKGEQSNLAKQLDTSLNKLNTDAVNVYFFHSYDDFINYPNLLEQLTVLKKQGKIKKIGLSVYENEEFQKAIVSNAIDVIQFPFNLLDNYSQRGDFIKLAKFWGKELHVRSVFLQGLFFKVLVDLPSKLKPLLPSLQKIHKIANSANVSMEQLALNYVLQQDEIDHVIIGVDTVNQLKNNIKMSKNRISNDVIKKVNEINVKEVELLYPKNW